MDQLGKQKRSKERIQIILNTAEQILLERGIDAITIANISKYSGLKRTSTYKFFPTPHSVKQKMSNIYIKECIEHFKLNAENINTDNLSVIVLKCVSVLFNYFNDNIKTQKIILSNEFSNSIETEVFNELSSTIQSYIDTNIGLNGT